MAAAAARNDADGVAEHSEGFHHLIIDASANQLLVNVWTGLSIVEHTELTLIAVPIDLTTVAEIHQPIVDAMAAGDVELACAHSRDHQLLFMTLLRRGT